MKLRFAQHTREAPPNDSVVGVTGASIDRARLEEAGRRRFVAVNPALLDG